MHNLKEQKNIKPQSNLNGVLYIAKPKGMVSSKVTHLIKKKLNTRRVGHVGTLDPLAEGVLAIALGRATRLQDYLLNNKKTYRCTIKLGEHRDTHDKEGTVVSTKEVPSDLCVKKVEETVKSFKGPSTQIAPIYSAIKYKGKPLYSYARSGNGEQIPEERLKRNINIIDISLIECNSPFITFEATVSKGTYIRTLAYDIAVALGTLGYVDELIRIEDAGYLLEDCLDLEWIINSCPGEVSSKIVDISELEIPCLPSLKIHHSDDISKLFNGKLVEINSKLEFHQGSSRIDQLNKQDHDLNHEARIMNKQHQTLGIANIVNQRESSYFLKLKRGLI